MSGDPFEGSRFGLDAFPLFPGLDEGSYSVSESSQPQQPELPYAMPSQTMATSPAAFSYAPQPFHDDQQHQFGAQPAPSTAAVDPSSLSGQPQDLPSLIPSSSTTNASQTIQDLLTLVDRVPSSCTPGSTFTFKVRLSPTRAATDVSRFRVHFGNQSVVATIFRRSPGQPGQGDELHLGVVVPRQPASAFSSGSVPLAIDVMDQSYNVLQPHMPLGFVQYQAHVANPSQTQDPSLSLQEGRKRSASPDEPDAPPRKNSRLSSAKFEEVKLDFPPVLRATALDTEPCYSNTMERIPPPACYNARSSHQSTTSGSALPAAQDSGASSPESFLFEEGRPSTSSSAGNGTGNSAALRHPPMPSAEEKRGQPSLKRSSCFDLVPGAPQPKQVVVQFDRPLSDMTLSWTHEEFSFRRRLVKFSRLQEGNKLRVWCNAMAQHEYRPDRIVVSCIFRDDDNDCYLTSVDAIYLLEALVGEVFSTEEKNRIRRNLEGFKPLTVSKGKGTSEEFFRRLMNFPSPKPRNIEKDVKIFPWKTLSKAVEKILAKYSAVPKEHLSEDGRPPSRDKCSSPGKQPTQSRPVASFEGQYPSMPSLSPRSTTTSRDLSQGDLQRPPPSAIQTNFPTGHMTSPMPSSTPPSASRTPGGASSSYPSLYATTSGQNYSLGPPSTSQQPFYHPDAQYGTGLVAGMDYNAQHYGNLDPFASVGGRQFRSYSDVPQRVSGYIEMEPSDHASRSASSLPSQQRSQSFATVMPMSTTASNWPAPTLAQAPAVTNTGGDYFQYPYPSPLSAQAPPNQQQANMVPTGQRPTQSMSPTYAMASSSHPQQQASSTIHP